MDFLQTKFHNQTKFNSSSIKHLKQSLRWMKKQNQKQCQSGFITALMLPFLSVLLTVLLGLTYLSAGIKNITRSQSLCIQQALHTQKDLGKLLTQLTRLNKKASYLSKARKTLSASIAAATASVVLIPKVPQLIKMRDKIKLLQKALIIKQKMILTQSFWIKKQAVIKLKQKFKNLKASQVKELTAYKKALAVKKSKIGSDAYIYKPVEDFKNQQKISYQWKISIFYPLEKNWFLFNNSYNTKYSCTSSLEQKGKKWLNILYH